MKKNSERQERAFDTEFTARRPLPAFAVDTSGIPANYYDTFNFSEINLLGLDIHIRNPLLRRGITSIKQLHETDDISLKAVGFGIKTITAAREAIERFRRELESLSKQTSAFSESETTQHGNTLPVTINAIEWMEKHDLTWQGTSKTSLIYDIEIAFGQNLGYLLIEKYINEGLSISSIASLIAAQSNDHIKVTRNQIIQFMRQYGIETRTTKENTA